MVEGMLLCQLYLGVLYFQFEFVGSGDVEDLFVVYFFGFDLVGLFEVGQQWVYGVGVGCIGLYELVVDQLYQFVVMVWLFVDQGQYQQVQVVVVQYVWLVVVVGYIWIGGMGFGRGDVVYFDILVNECVNDILIY